MPASRSHRIRAEVMSRAGFASTTSQGGISWNLELRWVEADLGPRTEWIWLTSWDYNYNIRPEVHVDVHGKALVLLYFAPPMSIPCQGNMTRAAWASEDGSISVFTPVTPSYTNSCYGVNFAGFGSATTLDEGGFAFFVKPVAAHVHPSGWYAYASGSGIPVVPPLWTRDRDGPVQRLASGAYLATRRDPTTCARSAEILGPSGQLCATLAIDGSEGCDEVDLMSADGTLALHHVASCSLRWWPMLGRAR